MAWFCLPRRSVVFYVSIVIYTLSLCRLASAGVSPSPDSKTSYDFIIIGGGAGGLAVASRISEGLPLSSVLVIEAGPDAPEESRINIPGLKGSTLGTSYDWNFTTIPQPSAGGRKLGQARGKVLGGSTALNLMTWDRASSEEYDQWSRLGNWGWDWHSMITAMTKVENFFRTAAYDWRGIGFGGPVQTIVNQFIPAQQDLFIPSMNKLGIPVNLNSLAGTPIGVMDQPSNIRQSDYKRSYAAHNPGYPSIAGSNLVIKTNTSVQKVNFKKVHGELIATGVTLANNTIITANKEVILSAGSFLSPGLLELSGIGNSSILTAAGIPTLIDLPGVGENLQDHIRIQASYQLLSNYTSFDILRYNTTFATEQMALYNQSKRSIYDYTGSGYSFLTWTQALGRENASVLNAAAKTALSNRLTHSPHEPVRNSIFSSYLSTSTVPDLEVIFSDGYTGVKGYPAKNTSLFGVGTFSLIAAVQHPFNFGSVHINVSSPTISTPPLINPNYLAQEYDVLAAVAALKYIRKLANTYPLRAAWTAEYEPGLAVVPEDDDAAYRDFVLNNTLTLYHPVGTCAMLPLAKGGVVSPELKVWGTGNLRVVDASIFPILISAHIQTATYGVAERAAEMIIDDWS